MNYGIQIATSGVLTSMYRQDVLTNNLANLNTVGFKPDIPGARQRSAARIEDGLGMMPSNELLEKLGAGVVPSPNRVVFEQGTLETTGNPLDLAIDGDGFFMVRSMTDRDADEIMLTRDGRMALDSNGRLVMAASGLPVLSENNTPITLDPGLTVNIGADGSIEQGGERVAKIRVVDVPGRDRLRKVGQGLFAIDSVSAENFGPALGRVMQGSIEGSAVNEIEALMDIQAASRSVAGNIGMIAYQDRMLEQAINRFGRIG